MAHVTLFNFSANNFIGDAEPIEAGDAVCGQETLDDNRPVLSFDDTAAEAAISGTLVMPGQFSGTGTLKGTILGCFASEVTVTDEAVFDVGVEALTPNSDEVDIDAADGFDTLNAGMEIDPVGTAGWPVSGEITLTNDDGVTAGDMVRFLLRRDTDHGSDTASGDFFVTNVEIWEDTA